MHEHDRPRIYPLTYTPVETFSDLLHEKKVDIGNTGGQYVVKDGNDFFEQHFAPDRSWDSALTDEVQRKHSTIYPAVLWEFLQWHQNLADTEPRKNIFLIRGTTNETMSNFRSKLLGKHYCVTKTENPQNSLKPHFNYEVDIRAVKEDEELMRKLHLFAERAKKMNYTTHFPAPQPGKMLHISVRIPQPKLTES